MKQLLITTTFLVLFVGCNINENKEARIQQLEAQNEKTASKLEQLEGRILAIEASVDAKDD